MRFHARTASTSWALQSDPAEDWRTRAACRYEDPELFFPVGTGAQARKQESKAVAICRRCKVLPNCRRFAGKIQPTEGVWAATTEHRRRWCQWCEQPFEYETEYPHSRICPTCAQNERFGDIVRARQHGPGRHQAAKTHCPKGHAYDEANTYTDRQGHRYCRKCRSAVQARYKARSMA